MRSRLASILVFACALWRRLAPGRYSRRLAAEIQDEERGLQDATLFVQSAELGVREANLQLTLALRERSKISERLRYLRECRKAAR